VPESDVIPPPRICPPCTVSASDSDCTDREVLVKEYYNSCCPICVPERGVKQAHNEYLNCKVSASDCKDNQVLELYDSCCPRCVPNLSVIQAHKEYLLCTARACKGSEVLVRYDDSSCPRCEPKRGLIQAHKEYLYCTVSASDCTDSEVLELYDSCCPRCVTKLGAGEICHDGTFGGGIECGQGLHCRSTKVCQGGVCAFKRVCVDKA